MISRRHLLMTAAAALAVMPAGAPVFALAVVQIGRDSPERKAILDVARGPVERRLGIKVVFVVARMAVYGEWAYAALRPRDAAGNRIDYRRTLFAKDFDPEQDSDHYGVLLRRNGGAWSLAEEAFLPTDVYWEEWETKYKLPRALFLTE